MAGGSTRWRGRSVISKVVVLLDAFTPARRELSLGELAEITGLPMSTTYRLASELVEWGGLQRAEGGSGYRIGRRMGELGALAPHSTGLADIAAPYLEDLHAATGQSVLLAVLDGYEALCVEVPAPAGRPVTDGEAAPAEAGPRLPLHATAAGKVLLAYAPPDLLDELLAAGLKSYTPHTVVAPSRLRRALTRIRRSGIASDRAELSLGDQSVAAPIWAADHEAVSPAGPAIGRPSAEDAAIEGPAVGGPVVEGPAVGGTVVAAVAVVVRSGRGDARRFAPAVRTVAISISRSLRRPAPQPVP